MEIWFLQYIQWYFLMHACSLEKKIKNAKQSENCFMDKFNFASHVSLHSTSSEIQHGSSNEIKVISYCCAMISGAHNCPAFFQHIKREIYEVKVCTTECLDTATLVEKKNYKKMATLRNVRFKWLVSNETIIIWYSDKLRITLGFCVNFFLSPPPDFVFIASTFVGIS